MKEEIYITKPNNCLLLVPGERFKVMEKSLYSYLLKHLGSEVCVRVKPENINKAFEEEKPKWTEWAYLDTIGISPSGDDLIAEDHVMFDIYERCNGRKVQLETHLGKKMIRAESSCSPQDKFDEEAGIRLATVRLSAKIYEALAEKIAGEM